MRKIKLFGYQLTFEFGKRKNHKDLEPLFTEPVCKVVSDGKNLLLADPNGYILPRQIDIKVEENLNSPISVTVRLYANPMESKDIKRYEK